MQTNLNIEVSALDPPHRRALEEVIGQPLAANQRLVISVTNIEMPPSDSARAVQSLDDWTKVYKGLSDAEIESIDRIVKTRANLTRNLPEAMDQAILDTDLLSEVLKGKNTQVLATARQYLIEHQRFAFSEITVYEIVRGMRAKQATQQLAEFLRTVATSDVFSVSRTVLLQAADLWVTARVGGHPKDDADLIIAATALQTGRVLVTGNTAHFSWIAGLQLADWRTP